MTLDVRYKRLKEHLSEENPLLLDSIDSYITLDRIAHRRGFLDPEESYTKRISWWPLISVLGTFSAGKSTFINNYIGQKVQESGNQAVDDKFTAICYGKSEEPVTLPGMALDADPRFPFYKISEEVNSVQEGEGDRVNQYLQLKTVKSDAVRGKIVIDSPGFDADSQRDTILKLTNHIVDMSDLVLIFFDARHPEPGAMRDTLDQLVKTAMTHSDADKVLYILNQIDTTAKEDNLEDVMGAWQRALAQKGLVSGDFYAIFNEDSMMHIEDEKVKERLMSKKSADLKRIVNRIEKVGIERAYRIIRALEESAKALINEKFVLLKDALHRWMRMVLWGDAVVALLILGAIAALKWQTELLATPLALLVALGFGGVAMLFSHFSIRSLAADFLAKRYEKEEDPDMARAIRKNTRWWRPLLGVTLKGWGKREKRTLEAVIEKSRDMIQKLNDQFIGSSVERRVEAEQQI